MKLFMAHIQCNHHKAAAKFRAQKSSEGDTFTAAINYVLEWLHACMQLRRYTFKLSIIPAVFQYDKVSKWNLPYLRKISLRGKTRMHWRYSAKGTGSTGGNAC